MKSESKKILEIVQKRCRGADSLFFISLGSFFLLASERVLENAHVSQTSLMCYGRYLEPV